MSQPASEFAGTLGCMSVSVQSSERGERYMQGADSVPVRRQRLVLVCCVGEHSAVARSRRQQ
jgi:hypothetical protein